MKNYVGGLWGIVGIGLLIIPVVVAAGASDKPVTGDTVIRETQEAATATKDYTIQQKVENGGCDGRSSRFSQAGPVSSPVTVDQ